MLNIIYGDVKNSIYNTNVYFKNSYELFFLNKELTKKIIKNYIEKETAKIFICCFHIIKKIKI